MRVCHSVSASFDDLNLVSCAGLAPVLRLAQRAGLQDLVAGHVRIGRPGGCNAAVKVSCLVAGMVAGADSIDDMALPRHGGMGRLFTGVRAPSTLGTFEMSREGCMSVPDVTGDVKRASRLVVRGLLPVTGEEVVLDTDAFEARALQHELDHLDGFVFLDRVAGAHAVFARRTYL